MRELLHQTQDGTIIYVQPGTKSKYDFIVKYKAPHKRLRTPKHIHIAVDLLMKRAGNPVLTRDFIGFILTRVLPYLKPASTFPPALEIVHSGWFHRFNGLDQYGEYSAEFLSVTIELLALQEKTNYPNGSLHTRLFRALYADPVDIFKIVSIASWR